MESAGRFSDHTRLSKGKDEQRIAIRDPTKTSERGGILGDFLFSGGEAGFKFLYEGRVLVWL